MPAIISVDFISIILILGIVPGAVFSIIALTRRGQHVAGKLLAMLMLVLIWYQVEFLLVRDVIETDFNLVYGTRYGSWLVLGPLIYVFTLSLTQTDFELKWKHLIYFMPFFLFTVALPLVVGDLIPERGKYYGMLTVMKLPQMGLSGMQKVYGILFFLQFLYTAIFVLLSHRKIRYHARVIAHNFSNVSYFWMSRVILYILLILLSSIVFFCLLYFSSIYERWMDYAYVLPVTFLIYWVSFSAIRKIELVQKLSAPLVADKYGNSSLTEDQAQAIASQLHAILAGDKPYLNNELTLADLASQLSVSTHYLSQVINEQLNTSFYNLINGYRIEEAKRLLKESKGNKTILQIAFDSGFNNKVSFNNYFKKYTGMTPRDFLRQKG